MIGTVIHGSVPYANAQQLPTVPTIIFTRDGQPIGRDSEPKANDLCVGFIKNIVVTFTKNGQPIGKVESPAGVDAFCIAWKKGVITEFVWITANGEVPVNVPEGANDIKVEAIDITVCFWTKDGKFLRDCKVPEGTNDFKFVVPESPIGIIAMIAPPLAVLGYWAMRKNAISIKELIPLIFVLIINSIVIIKLYVLLLLVTYSIE